MKKIITILLFAMGFVSFSKKIDFKVGTNFSTNLVYNRQMAQDKKTNFSIDIYGKVYRNFEITEDITVKVGMGVELGIYRDVVVEKQPIYDISID